MQSLFNASMPLIDTALLGADRTGGVILEAAHASSQTAIAPVHACAIPCLSLPMQYHSTYDHRGEEKERIVSSFHVAAAVFSWQIYA